MPCARKSQAPQCRCAWLPKQCAATSEPLHFAFGQLCVLSEIRLLVCTQEAGHGGGWAKGRCKAVGSLEVEWLSGAGTSLASKAGGWACRGCMGATRLSKSWSRLRWRQPSCSCKGRSSWFQPRQLRGPYHSPRLSAAQQYWMQSRILLPETPNQKRYRLHIYMPLHVCEIYDFSDAYVPASSRAQSEALNLCYLPSMCEKHARAHQQERGAAIEGQSSSCWVCKQVARLAECIAEWVAGSGAANAMDCLGCVVRELVSKTGVTEPGTLGAVSAFLRVRSLVTSPHAAGILSQEIAAACSQPHQTKVKHAAHPDRLLILRHSSLVVGRAGVVNTVVPQTRIVNRGVMRRCPRLSCCADKHGVMMHRCHAVQAGLMMMAVAAGLVDLQSCIQQVLEAAASNKEARLMWLTVLLGPGAFEGCSASPATAGLAAELLLLQRQLPLQLIWDQLRPLLEVWQLPLSQLATFQAAAPSRCSNLPATVCEQPVQRALDKNFSGPLWAQGAISEDTAADESGSGAAAMALAGHGPLQAALLSQPVWLQQRLAGLGGMPGSRPGLVPT